MGEISLSSQAHKPCVCGTSSKKSLSHPVTFYFWLITCEFKLCLHPDRFMVCLITSAEFKLLIFSLFLNPMFIGWSEWQVSHAWFFLSTCMDFMFKQISESWKIFCLVLNTMLVFFLHFFFFWGGDWLPGINMMKSYVTILSNTSYLIKE